MFIKQGTNRANGQPIYPHPSQTSTGNCAAYTGASCLYAFGLDHEAGLIPPASGGTPGEQFQFQMAKMIERLTALIYTDKNGVAAGYRKYIDEMGLACKFDVTEVPVVVKDYDPIAGERKLVSNLPYLLEQMQRCQDIMLHIEWDRPAWYNPFADDPKRHSVGLIGHDPATNELILNNPWGGTIHVNPPDAATNTTNGTGERFTRFKPTVDEDGYLHFDFFGHDARLYESVMICPATPHVVTLDSSAQMRESHAAIPTAERPGERALIHRYSYSIASNTEDGVNGFAVALPGLQPSNVVAVRSPKGWTSAPWYRGRETGFDQPAPDAEIRPGPEDFTGIIWRTNKRPLNAKDSLRGFALDVVAPGRREEAAKWEDDPLGHAVVLREDEGVTTAWHVSATTLRRKPLTPHPPIDPPKRDDSDRG